MPGSRGDPPPLKWPALRYGFRALRGNAPELLEFAKEAFDGVSFSVETLVVGALNLAVALVWDNDLRSALDDGVGETVGIVTLVGDDGIRLETFDQLLSHGDVVALARRTDEADGKAQSITGGMDLGAQAATRPAQALGIRPPLSLRAPAAC